MSVFSAFEVLWQKASDQEKRAIKSFVAAHKFPRGGNDKGWTLPDDYPISPTLHSWIERNIKGVNVSLEIQKARDWAKANAHREVGRKSDWDAFFRNWLRGKISK